MKEQYGEFEIRYDETREEFIAFKGDERVSKSRKLAELKKRLDRVGEVRSKFNRFTVLSFVAGNSLTDSAGPRIVEYEVTSVVQGDEVWMTNRETGGRAKHKLASRYGYVSFYADTEESRAALAAVVELSKQRNALSARIATALKVVTPAKIPEGAQAEAA